MWPLPERNCVSFYRWTRHAGHCWRSRDELIRDVLLWTPTHGRAKAGRPARTYIQQLCEDTRCCAEDLRRAMNDREEWRERVRDIRTTSATWWWWWWFLLWVVRYTRGFSLCCIFGFRNSVCGIFLIIRIPYLLEFLVWGCVLFFGHFFRFYPLLSCVFYVLEYKGWVYYSFGVMAFEVALFWGVRGFVVDISDDLAIYFFL